MAARKFGTNTLTGTVWNHVMTAQPGYDTTVTIHVTNHSQSDIRVDLAITADVSASVPEEDIFYLNQLVYAQDSRAFLGVVIEENQSLAARSTSGNVTILVYGFEEEQP